MACQKKHLRMVFRCQHRKCRRKFYIILFNYKEYQNNDFKIKDAPVGYSERSTQRTNQCAQGWEVYSAADA